MSFIFDQVNKYLILIKTIISHKTNCQNKEVIFFFLKCCSADNILIIENDVGTLSTVKIWISNQIFYTKGLEKSGMHPKDQA